MLALTEDACQAIEGILEQSLPGAGIRIAPATGDGSGQLSMSVAPEAAATDQQIESDGGPVFVDPVAQPFLDDKVLDASVSAEGVQFEILAQAA